MNVFLTLTFLFFIGSLLGWGIEVLFRRFISSGNPERKWINPGFLIGPYLPLYGFGLCFLYLIASFESSSPITNDFWNKAVLFLAMAIAMTAVEYIAGLIFIVGMKVKLWDYSKEWGNIQGIICPKFSFFWAVLGAVYYFLIHPHILNALAWLAQNLAFSFVVGFFWGVFLIDFVYSSQAVVKIRKFAEENGIIVRYEELKEHIRQEKEQLRGKKVFLFPMHTSLSMSGQMKRYLEKMKLKK